ncbi:DUF1289 domain-containing protein [Labrenzia sp. 011]|uniref:DUF1289 domain-containing protein n=1 Tax=Labrenzia sp. 011 TaxID=2171494 RepID=UPI000D51ABC2|nr:DUF1289 domain-containing protein [Labrenzia sp. 011]PVB63487.1 DUF1289 domain-containing protein [Labrenzia sp. 011]
MQSPCINICQIDRESRLCTGCLRSLDEIAGWAGFSEGQRREIMADLDRRREGARPLDSRR